MSKVLAAAAVAIVGGGTIWLFFVSPTADVPTTDEGRGEIPTVMEMTEQFESEGANTFSGSAPLLALLSRGDSFICSFQSEVEGIKSEGDFYTDGERYRVSAVTTAEGVLVTSDMINNGATTYVWSETSEGRFGFMMANELVAEGDGTEGVISSESSEQFDVDQSVEYECEGWLVNESFFTPPSDVAFTDMQQMMQGMMEMFGSSMQ